MGLLNQTMSNKEKIQRAFDLLDRNNSKTLNQEELQQFLQVLGHNPKKEKMSSYPVDTSFADAMRIHENDFSDMSSADKMLQIFRQWDPEGTGKIDFSALSNCLKTFAGAGDQEIVKLTVDLKVDGGKFDYVAFCDSMEAASFIKFNE